MTTIASGHGIATISNGTTLDVWFPSPALAPLAAAAPAELAALVGPDQARGVTRELVGIEIGKSSTDLEYLSSIENQIRRVLFFDKPKLLEIELQENGSPKIIKITEEHKQPEELARFFLTNKLPLGSKIMIEPRPQGNYKITIKSK